MENFLWSEEIKAEEVETQEANTAQKKKKKKSSIPTVQHKSSSAVLSEW